MWETWSVVCTAEDLGSDAKNFSKTAYLKLLFLHTLQFDLDITDFGDIKKTGRGRPC